VLAANGVETMIDSDDGTPVISHAILAFNHGRTTGLADGIVVTPSHNPPEDGGFKYNPPSGGPADTAVTRWIEDRANCLLSSGLGGVARNAYNKADRAATIHTHDYVGTYVAELSSVVDMEVIRDAQFKIGADPLGGASVAFWRPIADRFGIDVEVVNDTVDPTFGFMSVDGDGQIRMDRSSSYAMAKLIGLKDRFDIAFGNDPDADRHGIVIRSAGLMNPNDYLAAAIFYLFTSRPDWRPGAAASKTVVSSSSIDRVAAKVGCPPLVEVPVGFTVSGSCRACSMNRLALVPKRARARRFSSVTARSGQPIKTGSSWTYWPWSSWRPSELYAELTRTEDVYKLYAESFFGSDHLRCIQEEAQAIISSALAGGME
jgi:phosphoglucomutase